MTRIGNRNGMFWGYFDSTLKGVLLKFQTAQPVFSLAIEVLKGKGFFLLRVQKWLLAVLGLGINDGKRLRGVVCRPKSIYTKFMDHTAICVYRFVFLGLVWLNSFFVFINVCLAFFLSGNLLILLLIFILNHTN